MASAHDFSFEKIGGGDMPLAHYAGRPVLIVNTASRCGFTPQYAGLQAVWCDYRDRGLVVIGVPCNDFAGQEPGDAATISAFCVQQYAVDFPLTAKAHVRGPKAHPLFQWLAREGGFLARPRWNFYKYLIDKDGRLQDWFTSLTPPGSGRLRRAIDRLV